MLAFVDSVGYEGVTSRNFAILVQLLKRIFRVFCFLFILSELLIEGYFLIFERFVLLLQIVILQLEFLLLYFKFFLERFKFAERLLKILELLLFSHMVHFNFVNFCLNIVLI